ncbi:hypothetical protein [Leptolyngbya sp. NIES-2104]|uniref:hypothetical protein n=1 Tax=Leptolyngbya sp. NIES-2104 TaxID=1552121 RepID=UPI0006EC42F4|nr:hypothetical protein [Leptolyngbya sp. NIES-2104]GAP94917.1 hypothetical protein NIES2104_14350 [Leptolyngbya sp. NIES-2104]
MFKLISGLVAGTIVLAPLLPARADYGYRSTGFGITVGTPRIGIRVGTPYSGRYRPFRNEVILRRSFYDPYKPIYPNSYYPGRVYSPGFGSPVIVAPRARTVIIDRGNNNDYRSSYCGSVIYGSPIASPIPVDPFTGLACR